jgi:ketosteroid isomerase-like protein
MFSIASKMLRATLVVTLAAGLACSAAPERAQSTASHRDSIAAEEARIRAIDSVWSAALQARDLDAVMSNYAEDAAFLAPRQPLIRGKGDIRAWFERQTAVPEYSATFSPTVIVVAASRDMAYEIGSYRVRYRDSDGTLVSRVGKHLVTWGKEGGRWRVTAESISSDS